MILWLVLLLGIVLRIFCVFYSLVCMVVLFWVVRLQWVRLLVQFLLLVKLVWQVKWVSLLLVLFFCRDELMVGWDVGRFLFEIWLRMFWKVVISWFGELVLKNLFWEFIVVCYRLQMLLLWLFEVFGQLRCLVVILLQLLEQVEFFYFGLVRLVVRFRFRVQVIMCCQVVGLLCGFQYFVEGLVWFGQGMYGLILLLIFGWVLVVQ